jgi:segregation and condensation protein B
MKTLLERNLIKIIGKKEEVGRPILYGTSQEFLELFGLKNLRDLPTLREFAELTQESRDIYERRIGEALPGQGQGMDMQTHFDGAAAADEAELQEQRRADEEQAAREAADGRDEEQAARAEAADGDRGVERASADGVVDEDEHSDRDGASVATRRSEADGDEADDEVAEPTRRDDG